MKRDDNKLGMYKEGKLRIFYSGIKISKHV